MKTKRNRKSVIAGCILCLLAATACGAGAGGKAPAPAAAREPDAIDAVLENFRLLAEIPRPSHHEKRISDFLMGWAKDQGFSPVQDDVYNVMFDVPATAGCEGRPLCILQGHMDMVVAVEDGKTFDPLSDPITVIRDETARTLTADGTSLGGDDGIGVAFLMAVAQGKMAHGPVRILITVDEEDGMEGAFHLDASWLVDAACLINIDNESSDEVLVSTAAGDSVRISKQVARGTPAGDLALTVTLGGLNGGHSGIEIDKGRLNGVIGLASFLKELEEGGVAFELADFSGGTAANAIPTKATCTIVVAAEDQTAVAQRGADYLGRLKKAYAGIEETMTLTVTKAETLPQVVGAEEKANAIRFLTEIADGVHTWSADMEGLVESSSNLGIFTLGEDGSPP